MPIPTWAVGQVLAAADVNSWMVPLDINKAADQSITSNATPANDNTLVQAVPANVKYRFECVIFYSGGTQGSADIKFQFAVPASATYKCTVCFINTSGVQIAEIYNDDTVTPALQAGTGGAGNKRAILMKGTVTIGGTAGNFAFQWAQGTSNGTATTVHADSYLHLRRVA